MNAHYQHQREVDVLQGGSTDLYSGAVVSSPNLLAEFMQSALSKTATQLCDGQLKGNI